MRIAYITAGAGGMYCGSCLHDNTLVRAMRQQGADVQLVPTYTPIRTDEENVSIDRVFYNGINVYLQQKIPLFRVLPRWVDGLLGSSWLIQLLTARGMKTNARQLGRLTVSMLKGESGFQRKETRKLCQWLAAERVEMVVMSNMLIAGGVPLIKRELGVPVLITLQGDDVFLDALIEPFKGQAFQLLRELEPSVDGFLVHSRYYADFVSGYLGIDPAKIHQVPLGIDTSDFTKLDSSLRGTAGGGPRIGYLARLAPEKGLHLLVDAFLELKRDTAFDDAELHIAGWLGRDHQEYAEEQLSRVKRAGYEHQLFYSGSVDRAQKLEFLQSVDVLSVPTVYHDPKGLFVLEALAAGVPIVQPAHGAFPELLERTGGGCLCPPDDPHALAAALRDVLADMDALRSLGLEGRANVLERFNAEVMARETLARLKSIAEKAREAS